MTTDAPAPTTDETAAGPQPAEPSALVTLETIDFFAQLLGQTTLSASMPDFEATAAKVIKARAELAVIGAAHFAPPAPATVPPPDGEEDSP